MSDQFLYNTLLQVCKLFRRIATTEPLNIAYY